ncbi:hypothetical protein R1sor_008926 [Riccia sorocarpa]|uniref:Uncharacterized protein n=1 Tax=Riccia sorocarpa TaxID=122646 RepID=A0ABD3H749_9MARC
MWLSKNPEVQIIGFRELKTGEVRAEAAPRSLYGIGTMVIDYTRNEKGGVAIVLCDKIKVRSSGVKGADWINQAQMLHHEGKSGLSDHFPKVRRQNREKELKPKKRALDLEELHVKIVHQNTPENRKLLAGLEFTVKEQELKDAMAWRLRIKALWLREGDAHSHYFFAMLKSKFKREAIDTLVTDQGETLSTCEDILEETQRFYQELFSEEEGEDAEAKEAVLQDGLNLNQRRLN